MVNLLDVAVVKAHHLKARNLQKKTKGLCGVPSLPDNKGLCGVPSLPDCPMFWKNNGLSNGGKIAVGVSCVIVFLLVAVIVFICIRRRRNDYDFGLPQELMCKCSLYSSTLLLQHKYNCHLAQ